MVETDLGEMKLTPTAKGLYHHPFDSGKVDFWAFLNTVSSQPDKHTNRAVNGAMKVCHFQNILLQPGSHQLMDMVIKHLKHCPTTKDDIMGADDIFSPNLSSLKGKTVAHPNPDVKAGVDPVLPDILKVHHPIIIAINIMFVNKILFLITMSHNLHFETVKALPN